MNSGEIKKGYSKRFSTRFPVYRECERNEHKIGWHISPLLFQVGENVYCSFTIKMFGEMNGVWCEFCFYGITPDKLIQRITELENKLYVTWQAIGD